MPVSELNVAINGQDNISGVFKDILNTMSSFSSKTEKQLSGISKALEVLNSSLGATSSVAKNTASSIEVASKSISNISISAKQTSSVFSGLIGTMSSFSSKTANDILSMDKNLMSFDNIINTVKQDITGISKATPIFAELNKQVEKIASQKVVVPKIDFSQAISEFNKGEQVIVKFSNKSDEEINKLKESIGTIDLKQLENYYKLMEKLGLDKKATIAFEKETEAQEKLALAFTKTISAGSKLDQLKTLIPVFGGIAKNEKAVGDEAKNASEKTGLLHTKLSSLTTLDAAKLVAIYHAIKSIASAGFDLVKSNFWMAFETGKEIEQTRIAMEAFLGSAEKTKTMMTDLTNLAIATPFKFPELADSTKQLLAYGIEAKQAVGITKMLGDIASGVNAPLGDLAYLFGTMAASGRIYTRDINQLADRGIPILEYLAEVMDVDKTAIRGMVEAGEIGFNDVAKAMENMTTEGGKYHDMMMRQAFSLKGIWSTLSDNWEIMLREIIGINQTGEVEKGSVFDIIRIAGMELVMWMNDNTDRIKKFFENFVKGAVNNILRLVNVLGGKEGLTNIFYGLMNVLGFVGKAFLITAGVIVGIAGFIKDHIKLVTGLTIAYVSFRLAMSITKTISGVGTAISGVSGLIPKLITGFVSLGSAAIGSGTAMSIGMAIGTAGLSLVLTFIIGLIAYFATHREALDNMVIARWKYYTQILKYEVVNAIDIVKLAWLSLLNSFSETSERTIAIDNLKNKLIDAAKELQTFEQIKSDLAKQREEGSSVTGGSILGGLDFEATMEKYKSSMDSMLGGVGDLTGGFGDLSSVGGDALDKLSKKTEKLKDKIEDANDAINKENRDYKEKKGDKTRAYETDLSQMARDYNDAISKLDKDLVDKVSDLTSKYNEALVKLKTDLNNDLLDLANKYAEDSKNAETDRNESIAEIIVSKQEDLVKAQDEYNNATTQAEKDSAQAKIDTIQAFLDQHKADITESQAEISALIAYNALDEIDKIKFKYEQEKILRDQKYEEDKAERIAQYNEKVAEEKAQYEADMAQAKVDYEEKKAERNKQYEDDKADKAAKFKEDMKILKREHNEKLDELKKHLKEVKKELDNFNNSKTVKQASKYTESSQSGGGEKSQYYGPVTSEYTLPGRATGGPVSSLSSYIVGERGPELFVPATAGRIVNNDLFSGMGGKNTTVNVYATVNDKIDIDLLGEQIAWKINNTR